ncbi:DNA polymerase IV [Arcobacter sp. CECT 9188]|uniref:Y-family DNA polymerase n=1 Tax=Arcobacter sp. CECT 9188 TaxID=2044505 RepID=UPI000DE9A7BC|nr:DNA polymerase IV [Arcobacter sp. CECT 9188]RBQ25798.1 DNA polymerase IV [Arcobacter sp. CECT 9188]
MFIHLDLDCFFVSAHRTLDKKLLNIPVAVGGRSNTDIFSSKKTIRTISVNRAAFSSKILSSNEEVDSKDYFIDENGRIRGIITTCSYEARKFGVKTAMSVNEALRLCPNLKMIQPNYSLYDELSQKLKDILEDEIPLVEQFSIDEFFGDLSGYIDENEVLNFASKLKNRILTELKLPISIGIAKTKYLSKLFTEFAKPDGIKYIKSEDIQAFTKDIAIEKFTGIGKAFCEKLKGYNINTLGDIRKNKKLFYSWGKIGEDTYNRVCGIRDNTLTIQRERKSLGIGRSFDAIFDRNELRRRVMILSRYLSFIVKKEQVNPLSYAILIRYEFGVKSKNSINISKLFNEIDFKNYMIKLFEDTDLHRTHGILQLYITVFNFSKTNGFTSNLFDYEDEIKKVDLNNNIHKLREKYGVDIVKNAFEI